MPCTMNRTKTLLATTLVAGMLALSAFTMAQDKPGQQKEHRGFGGGFGRGFGRGSNSFGLLRRDDVKTDLQLTTDQKAKLDELMTSMRGQRGERPNRDANATPPTDAERQAMRAQMEARRAEQQKQIDAILTPAQTARLKEISLQLRGNMALLDPQMQTDLDFTSAQRDKVTSLRDKMMEASQTIFQKVQDGTITRDDAMKSMQKNGDIMKEELAKVLTRSQAEKFKSMQGAPFKADPSEQNRGFGFGGGFGGRGRRGGGAGGGN